ncbi:GTP-binding protein 8-like isoform X2 [Apostichopus japonicus]|uniref:GTP-binding protein 8-like isoform X2 n=1 Tax=Stichopus japonicus TaxID=307972 RepID=UPI003AB6C772
MSLTSNCNLVLLMYKSHVNWYKYVRSWERHLSNQSGKVILNPLVEQQKPFKEPLFPESNLVFTPSEKDVDKAQQLFVPDKNHIIKYCKGVYDPSQVPSHRKTEIAFLGRSNVGKSSLIKELLNAAPKVQVRTSKTPGHTKLVNFFEVGNAFMLVDMPGYGYRQPENFERSAEGYLNNSKRLSMTFLLVDSSVGLQPADYIAIDMLNEFGLPFTVSLSTLMFVMLLTQC